MSRLSDIYCRVRSSQLFKDSFWALLGSALGKGLALIAGIAIARMLGSEQFGEYSTIKNTLMMIAIFSSMGLGYSATKFIAESAAKSDSKRVSNTHRIATTLTLMMSGAIALLTMLFSKQLSIWLEAEHLCNTLRLSAIAIIFNAIITTQAGELAGLGEYKQLAKNSAWSGIITFITSTCLTLLWGFNGAIIALIISLLFNALLNYFAIAKHIDKSSAPIDKVFCREIIRFSLPIALQEGLYAITSWVTIFIIIKFANYVELGIYSAATQWMAVILFIPGALRNVALSHFSATNNNKQQTHIILQRLMLVNFISTFIPFLVILILSGWIEKLYGSSFIGLQCVLNICVFTAIVSSLTNVLTQEFISQGKNWFLFLSRLLRDVTIIIGLLLSINLFNNEALICAVVSLTGQLLYLMLLLAKYHKDKHV